MPVRASLRTWRRRLRISVRGLIVVVLVIGVGLGWIVQGARIQRQAVAAIRRDGGLVFYDWHHWDGKGEPGAPKWLVDRLGVDYFGHVVSVALGQPGSPSALRNIGQLSHVERLRLNGPFVTDAGLAHLKGLTDVYSLDSVDRYVICDGTIVLRGAARVTDAGMPYLKDLTRLLSLDLDGTQVSDDGLANLAGMTKLESLGLADTRVTDIGLVHLKGMTRLKDLDLSGTPVTDAGLGHLKTLITLSFLSFRGTRITDAGLAHLEGLTDLQRLDLSDTRTTDAGLAHLKGLSRLWDLDLRGTQVSRDGVLELALASRSENLQPRLVGQHGAPRGDRLEEASPRGDAGP
jgi:internalin A